MGARRALSARSWLQIKFARTRLRALLFLRWLNPPCAGLRGIILGLAKSIFSASNLCVQPEVRVLIFDNDAIDAELIRRALLRHSPRFQVRDVFTEQEYLVALRSFSPDIILSDYKLPLYGGASALKMARELRPGVPFILVSGVLRDGLATEFVKRGAKAYVHKSNLEELGPAIDQALAAAGQSRSPSQEAPPSHQNKGARLS